MDELTVVYMDEAHQFLSDNDIADRMQQWARESRRNALALDVDRLIEADDEDEYPR